MIYFGRTRKHNFEVLTQNHGETFAMMHHVVMGDDPEVKKRKPAPDAFLIALKRFEVLLTDKCCCFIFVDNIFPFPWHSLDIKSFFFFFPLQ